MEIYLEVELFLSETTMPDSEFPVNEFDCEEGLRGMEGYCFLDA